MDDQEYRREIRTIIITFIVLVFALFGLLYACS